MFCFINSIILLICCLLVFSTPPYTGGVFQYINTYGVQKFADRAAELSELYGERFAPPALLLKKAADGELFV